IAFHAREAKRKASRITRRLLNVTECDFHNQLRLHEHGMGITIGLKGQKLFGLPTQHLVGQPFEGLSEHHELPALLIARTEVKIGKPTFAAAVAPFSRKDDKVESGRLLQLEP